MLVTYSFPPIRPSLPIHLYLQTVLSHLLRERASLQPSSKFPPLTPPPPSEPMDRHSCKLCSRRFVNGRALGGHMKAHLAALSIPPRPKHHIPTTHSSTTSSSSSSGERPQECFGGKSPVIYGLRENPRRSIKFSDPEFSFSAAGDSRAFVIVQDGESEAESRDRDQVHRRRSQRGRAADRDTEGSRLVESPEQEPEPVSSVSDTSPEEDVAMCLMMLSREDKWRNSGKAPEKGPDLAEQKKQHQCEICKKCFRSSQALGGHRIIHKRKDEAEEKIVSNKHKSGSNRDHDHNSSYDNSSRIFECPFCGKVFGSGQALGGHKRSHLMGGAGGGSSASMVGCGKKIISGNNANSDGFIDLNLPAPVEDEDVYSVVSDDDGAGGVPANY